MLVKDAAVKKEDEAQKKAKQDAAKKPAEPPKPALPVPPHSPVTTNVRTSSMSIVTRAGRATEACRFSPAATAASLWAVPVASIE